MAFSTSKECPLIEKVKERDKIGVWGFGNVSRDVFLTLVSERLGKEIVFYGRPKEDRPNRARTWVEDLKANSILRPRIYGTNRIEDMTGLDAIFVGVGAPRKPGQTRNDLLEVNTDIITKTCLDIRKIYGSCNSDDLPVLVFMGNPITAMTWIGYKVTGFPKAYITGQAGNLDARRICHSISEVLGLSGNDMKGMVFGEHGDSMVASTRYFTVGGITLDDFIRSEDIDPNKIIEVIEKAKKGGTHFVNETGQSASAGPARAACEMLKCIITGETEVQPVVAIIEKEYNLIKPDDGLTSMAYGVPVKIGRFGVERIYELDVKDFRDQIDTSARIIKDDIKVAARILAEKYNIT